MANFSLADCVFLLITFHIMQHCICVHTLAPASVYSSSATQHIWPPCGDAVHHPHKIHAPYS
eukprot:c14653_g1_i1 orf=137-322(+)